MVNVYVSLETCFHDTHLFVLEIQTGISTGRTVPVKGLDTPTYSRGFLYLYYVLHCRIIVKTSQLWNNTWNHVVTKKVLNKLKYILYI